MIPADLIAKINEATLSSQEEPVIEKAEVSFNNGKIEVLMEDRRKAVSSDLAEERDVPMLLQGKTIPNQVTGSSSSTGSPSTVITTTPAVVPAQRTTYPGSTSYQQPASMDERIKSSITQRITEIEEASRKEVSSELKALSSTPAKKKSLYEESTLKTDLKIIGLKAGCSLLEKIVKDSVYSITKNN